MDRDPHRLGKATPHMRRLAASIARSAETARTLPGRLSRSLAPTREGRQRRLRNLLLLGVALLPFLLAWATLDARRGHGEWLVEQELAAPRPGSATDAGAPPPGLLGTRVRFERHRVRAETALACRRASYHWLRQPREEVLASLAPVGAGAMVAASELPAVVTTLRVECEHARFDYHQAGDDLLLRVDGYLLRLKPP